MVVKIDPNQDLMLSKISWPLALNIVNDAGETLGLAHYDHYEDVANDDIWLKRLIYYQFGSKRLCLVVKNST